MIYVALALWLFLVLFAGMGVYRLLSKLLRPRRVDWILLPGTVVSEMAYLFGCLVTGAEVRRARLFGPGEKTPKGRSTEGPNQTTEATARLKVVGPMIAALIAMVGCMAVIIAAHSLLGSPVIRQFATAEGTIPSRADMLPRTLPGSWDALWEHIALQVQLLRRICETWGKVNWLDWRVPLFVYLGASLAIRLAPVSRPVRPTLGAAAAAAILIPLLGAIAGLFGNLVDNLWPLLSYLWSLLLFLLVVTSLVHGIVALLKVLTAKGPG